MDHRDIPYGCWGKDMGNCHGANRRKRHDTWQLVKSKQTTLIERVLCSFQIYTLGYKQFV